MKKLLFLIMLILTCSCSKHKAEPQMVTISFNQQMVTGLPMTKGETNDFLNIIAEQTPTYVNVTLKNLDLGKTFTCKSNESITIPLGEYEISAVSNGGTTTGSSYGSYYSIPKLKVNTNNIKITATTKEITLNAYYACYAVFALIDECAKCSFNTKYGKYYVAYFFTDASVTLTPYEEIANLFTTTYEFSIDYIKDKIYAEYGKYYVIHPQQVDKVTSSFTMQLPNMVEGEI
jgi:hypothetical protein